jgi:hypothetical protein
MVLDSLHPGIMYRCGCRSTLAITTSVINDPSVNVNSITTPVDKANELISKYIKLIGAGKSNYAKKRAIKCALVAVNLILESGVVWVDEDLAKSQPADFDDTGTEEFWNVVKRYLEIGLKIETALMKKEKEEQQ